MSKITSETTILLWEEGTGDLFFIFQGIFFFFFIQIYTNMYKNQPKTTSVGPILEIL